MFETETRGVRTRVATVTLLAVAACWGSTFVLIKDVVQTVPVLDFLGLRFAIAALALGLVFPGAVARLGKRGRRRGVILGLLYGAAQILQTWGLETTPASVSGFVTGLYVIVTPILAAALLRHRIGRRAWFASVIAVGGLAVLTLHGWSVGFGEGLTAAAAVLYGVHILALSSWSTEEDALGSTIVQLLVVAVLCTCISAPNGLTLPSTTGAWVTVLYLAIAATGLTLLGQTWAQSQLTATRTAVAMSTEPVFAAFFAVGWGGEMVTSRLLIGGGMVLGATLLSALESNTQDPPVSSVATGPEGYR